MRRIGALLLVALSGCSGSNQSSAAGWPFDPVQFFTGHTTGKARLHLITGAVRNVAVDSHGEPDAHGGLVLVQAIAEDGKPARTRRWTLHPAGANRWLRGALVRAVVTHVQHQPASRPAGSRRTTRRRRRAWAGR